MEKLCSQVLYTAAFADESSLSTMLSIKSRRYCAVGLHCHYVAHGRLRLEQHLLILSVRAKSGGLAFHSCGIQSLKAGP